MFSDMSNFVGCIRKKKIVARATETGMAAWKAWDWGLSDFSINGGYLASHPCWNIVPLDHISTHIVFYWDSMVIQWDLIGFNGIYDGIASGYVKIAIENGHRNSFFTQLERHGDFP